jgi:hypothetical protein
MRRRDVALGKEAFLSVLVCLISEQAAANVSIRSRAGQTILFSFFFILSSVAFFSLQYFVTEPKFPRDPFFLLFSAARWQSCTCVQYRRTTTEEGRARERKGGEGERTRQREKKR